MGAEVRCAESEMVDLAVGMGVGRCKELYGEFPKTALIEEARFGDALVYAGVVQIMDTESKGSRENAQPLYRVGQVAGEDRDAAAGFGTLCDRIERPRDADRFARRVEDQLPQIFSADPII